MQKNRLIDSAGAERIRKAARILVIGSPGSGKTTFARQLARALQRPVHGMDDLYWQAGWQRLSPDALAAKLDSIIQEEYWIIEGHHATSLDRRLTGSDLVIYLDLPRHICLWRVFYRGLKRWCGNRESLPDPVRQDPQYRIRWTIDWRFVRKILSFTADHRIALSHQIKSQNPDIALLCLRSVIEQQALLGGLDA